MTVSVVERVEYGWNCFVTWLDGTQSWEIMWKLIQYPGAYAAIALLNLFDQPMSETMGYTVKLPAKYLGGRHFEGLPPFFRLKDFSSYRTSRG